MSDQPMTRRQLLAAEIFGYSYANYMNHLGIGNIRFDSLMPKDADKLERAVAENWNLDRVARELDVDADTAASLLSSTRDAIEVVDAKNPAEAFRIAVRQVVRRATTEGINDDESIEQLVEQICYRASDLGYLLKRDGIHLSRYSRHLRRERDHKYYEGYFDEED